MTKTNNKSADLPNVKIIKHNLKILSWNIQSPSSFEGNKFENSNFVEIINHHDFACLQETRRDVHLAGYRSVCNTRNDKKHGGVSILIRNNLIEGTEIIKNLENSDYMVCKLNKEFFSTPTDVFIVNSYIKPQNSSATTPADNGREAIKHIEDVINDLRQHGDIILCGDFNARIGQKPGTIDDNSNNFIPLPDDYIPDELPPRHSQDIMTNTYGNYFINLIQNNQLKILNGRTLGDFTGQFTSIQKNGCSVIDYFAVSNGLYDKVDFMKVLKFNEFSDHRPLSIQVKCNNFTASNIRPLKDCFEHAPCRYILNEESIQTFIDMQSEEQSQTRLDNLNNLVDMLSTTVVEDDRSATETAIKELNKKFTDHLNEIAHTCFKETKPQTTDLKSNKPWFNWRARVAKREYRKATEATANFPSSNFLRTRYYQIKKDYKKIISSSTTEFFEKMNSDIEDGKVLNWQAFKRLKKQKTEELNFDSHDMTTFQDFFSNLYSDNHLTVTDGRKSEFIQEADMSNETSTHSTELNSPFAMEEINHAIKSLKTGKASSMDMINNEILKSLNSSHKTMLQKLFNLCFSHGLYPWNDSIISPLHKKGSKSNPDNYRAVAVSSVIGKLFSTTLLERLIKYRNAFCPDPPNQLGFTKKAQTYDHILTMKTIASKYKRLGQPVYAVFVDFKKAFDSVCRQALFLKLAKNGITGNFYNILRNMYSNSYAYIKLSGHLSKRFKISKGTEQGHPLSPDLFKVFLSDLSPLLEFPNCPTLNKIKVSHLLWADDLILLSLDSKTCQSQLDRLSNFCQVWGIEINELKTQVVIFGSKTTDRGNESFLLNGKSLQVVESYCYLGIILHQSGSMKLAQQNLKTKAMRAFFGLKRSVIRSKLSFKALSTLFDSLIKPIVLYGAPIWVPCGPVIKSLIRSFQQEDPNNSKLIKSIGQNIQEKVHLPFLKWALGVHRKSSNVGVWGETGRFPLIFEAIRLSLNYFKRINTMDDNSLVNAAVHEQKALDLPWYKSIKHLLKLDEIYSLDHVTAYQKLTSRSTSNKKSQHPNHDPIKNLTELKPLPSKKFRVWKIMNVLRDHFSHCWEASKSSSPKLQFYHLMKSKFKREPYLDICKGFSRRASTTKLRISAHDLQIEKGRYLNISRDNRFCPWCQTSMGIEQVENEEHMLYNCDLYSKNRSKLISRLNNIPFNYPRSEVNAQSHIFNLNTTNLRDQLKHILSPNLIEDTMSEEWIKSMHCPRTITKDPKSHLQICFQNRRSYAITSICTYILECFEERNKFTSAARRAMPETRKINNITVNIVGR